MPKFATAIVEDIKAREVVEQLVVDGLKVLDSFEESLQGTTYLAELDSLKAFIEHFSNGRESR